MMKLILSITNLNFWLDNFSNTRGLVSDKLHDYNNEGLDETVPGAKIIPNKREVKNYWFYSDVNESEIN